MIKIGIIGTGNVAGAGHAMGLLESRKTQLWSVLSRDFGRASEFAKKYKAHSPTPAYDSMQDFLSDPDLDGVIVTSPDKLHFEHGMLVAKHKKPMLMEKPFVTDLQQGQELLNYCNENSVPLAIAYHLRWHRGHQAMLRAIRAGEIGKVLLIRALWTWKSADASNWRAHEELGKWWSVAGVGTHCLDLARWILGEYENKTVEIGGQISSPIFNTTHDELANIQIKTNSGCLIDIATSAVLDSPSRIEVYGTAGHFICEGTLGRHGSGTIYSSVSGELKFRKENPFKVQLERFRNFIKGEDQGMVLGEEGLTNVKLLLDAVG